MCSTGSLSLGGSADELHKAKQIGLKVIALIKPEPWSGMCRRDALSTVWSAWK